VPASLPYDFEFELADGVAMLTVRGELDDNAVMALRTAVKRLVNSQPKKVVVHLAGLRSLSERCARAVAFDQQGLPVTTPISLVGANPEVRQRMQDVGALYGVTVLDDDNELRPVSATATS
jgi:anti-anti-sigma regulatory factor